MLWSDSTHLANFGSASVWPLYLYFGNLSKYFRGKPGSGASNHITYIPSVSTCLCDSSLSQYSLALTDRFLTLYMMLSQVIARKPASSHIAIANWCTAFGPNSLMMNLWRLIVMVSWWSALMVYGVSFTHKFLCTQQTILRSKPIQLSPLVHSTNIVYKSATRNHPKQWRLPMSPVYNKKKWYMETWTPKWFQGSPVRSSNISFECHHLGHWIHLWAWA